MRFVKAHGTGNDFVLLPDLDGELELTAELVRTLCAPHLGLGADGVIRIAPAESGSADVFMDYWNADGSLSEMCGNGVRCVAKYVLDRGVVSGDQVRVLTRGGVKPVEARRGPDGKVQRVRVDMGAPVPGAVNQPLDVRVDGVEQIVRMTTLSMGNPHAVLLVDDVATAPVHTLGSLIEGHSAFPHRTNVEFIAVPARDRVEGRIWERGVGETMASGTGSSAMAVAAHLLGLADRRVTVSLPGGEIAVDWTDETLYMEGPAVEVAEGELNADWLSLVARA